MSTLPPVTRSRLEMQGFVGLDDRTLAELAPWLRFTPAVCTALVGLGTFTPWPWLLWALAPIAALGAIFPVHPFDLIYNRGVRRWTGTRPLPPNGPPRRFACGVAAVWLAGTALAFSAGYEVTGFLLGGVLTVVGLLVSTNDFCIPSLVYGALFGRPRAGGAKRA